MSTSTLGDFTNPIWFFQNFHVVLWTNIADRIVLINNKKKKRVERRILSDGILPFVEKTKNKEWVLKEPADEEKKEWLCGLQLLRKQILMVFYGQIYRVGYIWNILLAKKKLKPPYYTRQIFPLNTIKGVETVKLAFIGSHSSGKTTPKDASSRATSSLLNTCLY